MVSRHRCGELGEGRGGCAPEVRSAAVLGQHVAAAALEVQQAAVEGAVMRVSEGCAGGGSRQAAGAAAAGTQGGGLVLASAPGPVRHIALPAVPHAETPRDRGSPGSLRGLGLRPPGSPRAGSGHPLVATPGTARPRVPPPHRAAAATLALPPSFLPPRLPRTAVPRAHSPHRPGPRHSRGHRRAAGSAGSGSAPCRPRRSRWCKRPRPSAPRRPPPCPGAHTTGRGLRRQERGRVTCPSLALRSRSSPTPIVLAGTLASLTAAAGLSHLRPAVGAGEGGALLQVALHVAPLRTDVTALGTSRRAWGPWPHPSGGPLGHSLREQPLLSAPAPQEHPCHVPVGDEIQPLVPCPSPRTPLPALRGGAFF